MLYVFFGQTLITEASNKYGLVLFYFVVVILVVVTGKKEVKALGFFFLRNHDYSLQRAVRQSANLFFLH